MQQQQQQIQNLLNEASDSKFVIKKWNVVNDQSKGNHGAGNEIIYNTEVLKSNVSDDAYILIRRDITVIAVLSTEIAFKNCAPFTKFVANFDGTTIDHIEDLVIRT